MTSPDLKSLADMLPPGITIHPSPLTIEEPFIETAGRFAHLPGTVLLASGGDCDCARYNILGIWPWLTLRGGLGEVTTEFAGRFKTLTADPLTVLNLVLQRYRLAAGEHSFPLSAGLLGYLSYDLKDSLEDLPRTSIDDLDLPHLFMTAPSLLIVEDRIDKKTTACAVSIPGDPVSAADRLSSLREMLCRPASKRAPLDKRGAKLASFFSQAEYLAAIETIRDYIVRGHVYQVNLSQRFEAAWEGEPFDLFKSMFAVNPAPFFAFINAGDHHIVSTSPERFLRVRGKSVETRPIKGTRPRGKTPEQDRLLREELKNSGKDDAELSMIVDLLRNDLGKVCLPGSVNVREHKRIEEYENVFHLVSVIEGTLDRDKDPVDLVRAAFPGGSVTGCPKIKAMEIIDELEPVRRHVYTGSVGYFGFHDTMDLSIAIRTAIIKGGRLLFSIGGGVVYDSKPADEYLETLHKGRTLMSMFELNPQTPAPTPPSAIGWCNGAYKPLSEITVSVEDEGFQYGYGIFETIRVQRGAACRLDAHIERFKDAWRFFFKDSPPDLTWGEIIRQVVERSGLSGKTAAVKILAAAGRPGRPGFNKTLVVFARHYVHRLQTLHRDGLYLSVYPFPRHSRLSSYKTMNYLFCTTASDWAKTQGADEAIVLNADGSVSETNTANIFCLINGTVHRPFSEHALAGTMERAVCDLLAAWNIPVETRALSIRDVKNAEKVFLTNALMGAAPVLRIDETNIPADRDGLCRRINRALLGEEVVTAAAEDL